MEAILVSACLLGVPCRYDGDRKPSKLVQQLEKQYRLIPVCPEVMGGLPVPRVPAEIQGDRVITKDGRNVTDAYHLGAAKALEYAEKYSCCYGVLKARSPSCGCGSIHNGRFDGGLCEGDGMTVRLLKKHGICVITEEDVSQLEALMKKADG